MTPGVRPVHVVIGSALLYTRVRGFSPSRVNWTTNAQLSSVVDVTILVSVMLPDCTGVDVGVNVGVGVSVAVFTIGSAC